MKIDKPKTMDYLRTPEELRRYHGEGTYLREEFMACRQEDAREKKGICCVCCLRALSSPLFGYYVCTMIEQLQKANKILRYFSHENYTKNSAVLEGILAKQK